VYCIVVFVLYIVFSLCVLYIYIPLHITSKLLVRRQYNYYVTIVFLSRPNCACMNSLV